MLSGHSTCWFDRSIGFVCLRGGMKFKARSTFFPARELVARGGELCLCCMVLMGVCACCCLVVMLMLCWSFVVDCCLYFSSVPFSFFGR